MFAFYRLISVVIVWVGLKTLHAHTFFHLLTAVGLGHYSYGFLASQKHIQSSYFNFHQGHWPRSLTAWATLVLSVYLAYDHFPGGIVIAFAVHNAFSDVYLFKQTPIYEESAPLRVCLNLCYYFRLVFPELISLPEFLLAVGLLIICLGLS